MVEDRGGELRRCEPLARDHFTISPQQLLANGQPHRSIHEMLGAGGPAELLRQAAKRRLS